MTRKLTLILLASNVAAIDAVLANATIGDSGNGEHDTQQAHATGTVGANATIGDVGNGDNGTQLATATGVVESMQPCRPAHLFDLFATA